MTRSEYYAYSSWHAMNRRCNDSDHASFKHYGARGIKVCPQWHRDNARGFQNFLSDIGPRPINTSLHRIDHDSDYSPANCQWREIGKHNRKLTVAEAGRKGGLARAKALSPQRRSEIASIANRASLSGKQLLSQVDQNGENKK